MQKRCCLYRRLLSGAQANRNNATVGYLVPNMRMLSTMRMVQMLDTDLKRRPRGIHLGATEAQPRTILKYRFR